MTFRILGGSLLAVWTIATVSAMGQGPTSVNDGVFTADQAKRGQDLYAKTCASCHGDTLQGGDMAPPLAGKDFMANWVKQSTYDLYVKIHDEMPQDNPGTLTGEQTADAISFILSSNKYPAGQAELSKDRAALEAIKIDAAKAQ